MQFLGHNSSHELAALLLSEVIQYSLFTSKKPLFAIFLDAKSAFDFVQTKLLMNNLYHAGTTGHSWVLVNNRLQNRTTFIEFDKQLMGPIADELGLEQGGTNSGEYYKIFGKEQLSTAQASGLGIKLGNDTIVSAIAQADDTALVSDNLHSLQNLINLSLRFCSKYQMQLCVEKTKLLAIFTPNMTNLVEYLKMTSPVSIAGTKIEFSETVEHVGILRNSYGNLPNIINRILSHKKALGAVLHACSPPQGKFCCKSET